MRQRALRAAVLAVIVLGALGGPAALPAPADTEPLSATVGLPTGAPALASGYVGVSFEFSAVRAYTGSDPRAVNPVLVGLLRALAPGAGPVIRIGGNSTDRSWWPVRGQATPPGVSYALSPAWMSTTRALARALHAHLIVGVNLGADRPDLSGAEARALLSGLGRSSIQALEIGNEPDVYNQFPWSTGHSRLAYYARPQSYDLAVFDQDFSRWSRVIPPGPLAGPAFAELTWLGGLRSFVASEPRLRVVTIHRYPLRGCESVPIAPGFASIPSLLADSASAGMALNLAPYVRVAHDAQLPFRVGEMNSASCSGKQGVSNTFAASLWVLDTLFNFASVGVDGVNIHSLPGAPYEPFTFSRVKRHWQAFVHPEYYGMLMFSQAFPAGARLLPVNSPTGPVKIWATRSPTGRTHVVLINKSTTQPAQVSLAVPGSGGRASLEWLRAPSISATRGVTLGGQSFGTATRTGTLAAPRTTAVQATAGRYSLSVPAASAVMLTQ